MPIIKPKGLKQGDKIGVISPAGPICEKRLKTGLAGLEAAGYRVQLAPHLYEKNDYLAGSDPDRLMDFHEMIQDVEIRAVFTARGGYGCMRLLNRIDYELIRRHPKIIVGFSDITALLMAIFQKTGLVTIHGSTVRDLFAAGQDNWEGVSRLLTGVKPLRLQLSKGEALVKGRAMGRLLGGNLSIISHLIGTPFLPSFTGCLLFLEDIGEPLYRLDRMLTHLILAGRLDGISGIIVGQFEGCGELSKIERLFIDRLAHLKIPIATGFPAGHGPKNQALPLGLIAELDTYQMTLSTVDACVDIE